MKWLKKWFARNKTSHPKHDKQIVVTIDEVRKAINAWEHDMPDQIKRTQLLREDQSVDLARLTRYLGGTSDQRFYMSRFTYQLFEETDKDIPYYIDMVQAAVDDYMDEHPKLPVIEGSRNRQIHYDQLIAGHYLKEKPSIPLFLTTDEFLLTHEPEWHVRKLQ
ncbi:DUF3939 domain-containing protein [Paenibacillus aquistagni]|uniref:DUF3939 domain-containing protein n=1 Tax=Paenibacillus aquistagni TaxID=1852522 RepID=A0A1X7IRJ7_9BACL|nr:DUF3939 domain-containing protein [Paenibacillus aquistagni]SMG17683.1 Protein of unknown function [Paenibacillus aquistagni]